MSRIIDIDLTKEILKNYNDGMYDNVVPVEVHEIPEIDGGNIIDRDNIKSWTGDLNAVEANLRAVNDTFNAERLGKCIGEVSGSGANRSITFTKAELEQIGVQLYPYVAYGILNGGSATSYVDTRKNEALNADLMRLYRSLFEKTQREASGLAKGITPAYTNPDGTSGESFIELKMRAILIQNLRYRKSVTAENELFTGDSKAKSGSALFPMFQMTSVYNDEQIKEQLSQYRSSPLLSDLMEETGVDITRVLTGVQPMLAALTHSEVGRPKQIFTNAWGRDGEMLPIPGGHGQNFLILSEVYRYLYNEAGKKFIYISNVDNLGNLPDAAAIALTALSGAEASFEFAFRTPVDIKGGILIRDRSGRLNCADIGPAISRAEVDRQEASGKKILYNCATGLFNLKYLTDNLDRIARELPMRITDQDKDAGRYSQAEQVTWEIIGMLDNPLILGVNKYQRYLAAKLLIESFMTSGLMLESPDFPRHEDPEKDFRGTARNLFGGLKGNLTDIYGMELKADRWEPEPVSEIIDSF